MKTHNRSMLIFAFVAGMSVPLLAGATLKGDDPLTPEMARTIENLFPGASIGEVSDERILVLFTEATVKFEGAEYDLTLSQQGDLLLIKEPIDPRTLPADALRGIHGVESKERIREAERIRVVGELRAVALATPQIQYSAKFNKDGRELEVYVSDRGDVVKILKKLKYEE